MMLTSFFILCDQTERAAPELMSKPLLGGFIKGGVCATIAWAIAWPVEVVKSKVQGVEAHQFKGQSTMSILQHTMQTEGLRGLYRGFLPGHAAIPKVPWNCAEDKGYRFLPMQRLGQSLEGLCRQHKGRVPIATTAKIAVQIVRLSTLLHSF